MVLVTFCEAIGLYSFIRSGLARPRCQARKKSFSTKKISSSITKLKTHLVALLQLGI
jgi:hypothetical protein